MSGFILACARDRAQSRLRGDDLADCARHVSPDHIAANPPDVLEADGLVRAVVNPVAGVRIERRGVLLGGLHEDADWAAMGAPPPDGTFAIARHDERSVELVTDAFGTRTIWYVLRDNEFLASTSQRALASLLGDFEPRPDTVSWMLAAGNLGPDGGWDRRLQRLPQGSRLSLDREAWAVSVERSDIEYVPRSLTADEHLARLRDAIFAACAQLDVCGAPSALTLSGGCDSRSLLVGLAHAGRQVTCVTWGLATSPDDPLNDAHIARKLSERFGMPHEYLDLGWTDLPKRDVLTRFLHAGEGRIEDFSGYTDGFKAWERLFSEGVATVIRGDCPGWGSPYPPINESVARSINMHCTLVSDYPESHVIHRLGLAPQRDPDELYQRQGETLDGYRDRLYNDFEMPTCMAAFNEVKCAYAEVVNPLLARAVVDVTTGMPDELRHCRVGFERLAGSLVPDIPFAEHAADERPGVYLSRPEVREELLAELSSADARRVFAPAALDSLVGDLERPLSNVRRRLRSRAKAIVPKRVVRTIRPSPRPSTETKLLVFRAYIASRMAAILREDAVLLRR